MFTLRWTKEANQQYRELKDRDEKKVPPAKAAKKTKSSKDAGLFKQILKALKLLQENPRHPGLQTHPYHSLPHPYQKGEKVFEAYAQNNAPGAYRVFWCYRPRPGGITDPCDHAEHP